MVITWEEYADVPEQMMRWVKVNGRPMRGLVRRRRAEAGLYDANVDRVI